jgi:hypothetical protein
MASAIERQPCIKCDKSFGKNMCIGCQQWFCNIHYNQHQEELAKEMDNVTQKHDELHSHLTVENMDSEHPLLLRIYKWEQQSIHRIHIVANEVRTKLKQSLDQIKKETKASLIQVAEQLKTSRISEDYTEMELKRWMDQLECIKQRLLNPLEIELCGDTQDDTNASIIRYIELKIHRILGKFM